MTHGNDWSQWGELWRDQQTLDVARLGRNVSRKYWRMRGMVMLEIVLSLVACVQCVRLMTLSSGRWQWWSVASLLFVLLLQGLYLHARRNTWRASGRDVRSLMQLMLRRCRAGIRLAQINLAGTLIWVAVTVLVTAPDLMPSRWAADPRLKTTLMLQLAVNTPLVLAIIGICLWYIRRQQARIVQINTWLASDSA